MAGQEFFGIGIDTKKLEQDAEKAKQAFDKIGKEAEKQSTVIDKAFSGSTISLNLEKELQRIDKMSIDAFSGISSNAQRMIKEIQEDILSLSNVEKMMSQLNTAYEKGTISQNEYINTAARLEVLHRNLSAAIQDNEKALKAETVVVEKLANDSMVALQAKVTMLTTSFMKLSEAQRTGGEGEALLKNISEIQAKLNSAQVMMNKYGATSASQFNVLGMSIQQIARELPALTISPQMFFLAISNNLPIFTDALARARQEFQAMTAAGKQAVPVWKQVTKSLFSWQTAVSLLPTLLLLYGDKIVDFFEQIFTGSKKIDLAAESLAKFREALAKGVGNAQSEVTELKLLYDATQDVTVSVENRKKAIDELQEKYPQYFGNMKDEDILAGQAADSYDRLTKSIVASAKAKAMADLISENELKIYNTEIQLQEKRAQLEKERAEYFEKAQANEKGRNVFTALQLDTARNAMESTEEEIGNLINELYRLQKFSTDTQNRINVEDLIFDTKEGGKGGKKAIDNLKQYLNELLGLQEDNEERQIELTKTGTEKQIALIELKYKRQIEAIKKLQEELKKAQGGILTDEQQGVFGTAISGLGTIKQNQIDKILKEQFEKEKNAMLDYLSEYGDYWEKRKAIAEKYQNEIAKASTQGEKLSLKKEMTEALAALDDEAQKKTSIIVQLFGNMANKSVAEMRRIADEAENLLSFIEGGEYQKGNAFGITEEQFKVLSQSPEKLDKIREAIIRLRMEADNTEPVFTRIKNGLTNIFSGGSEQGLSQDLQSLSEDIGAVASSVSFLTDAFASLGDAFGSDVLSGIAEGLNVAMDSVNKTLQGAQAGMQLGGEIGAMVGAAVGLATSLATSIAKLLDKKNEKQIQQLQDQIDTLSAGYEKLGREAEKAFSTDAYNLIMQQNELLEQQRLLIQQQIAEERDKKKSDDGRIKEWEQQLEEINEQLEENKNKAYEAIAGTTIMSAIDQFAQAYADAWANGTDAAEASTDLVKKLIQTSLIEFMKKQLSPEVENFMKYLAWAMRDGVISAGEEANLQHFKDLIDEIANNYFGQVGGFFDPEETENEIQGLEELKNAYDKLSESVSKVYSQDAVNILIKQNENLREQVKLIQQRIEEEKKAEKPDTSYLEELEDELESINEQIADNAEAMKDAIFGEDIQSAISNFVNAYVEAIGNGGNMQQASRDFIENMIKNMVMESMKADASPIIEDLRNKMVEAWKDGVISADEQTLFEDLINNLNKELGDKYEWADDLFKVESTQIEGLEELKSAYNELSESISNAYSSEKAELIRQQIELLEQQKNAIEAAIASEEAKGDYADSDLIGGWRDELENINQQIEDNKQAAIDAIYGENIQSQVSNLANALINAWASGDNAAKSSEDFVKSIIKNMVAEAVKMDLSPFMEQFREQMKETMTDGIVSAEEGNALKDLVSGIAGALEDKYDWAQDFIKDEEEVVEAVEEAAETFSDITFESIRDDFTSQLSDMTTSYEDMCNNFEEKLKESIIRGFIESKYKNQIQNLISTWDMYGASGNIDESEMEKLREQYKDLISAMIKDRDELADQFEWSKFQQEATSSVGTSITQETGEEISGRLTAMYESELRREAIQTAQLDILRNISTALGFGDVLNSIPKVLQKNNISIGNVDIDGINDSINQVRDITQSCYLELVAIKENTGAIVKPIQQIQKDIAEVKQNTSKL